MHKLVRDKIPELVFNGGFPNPGTTRTVEGESHQAALINKFDEEIQEVRVAFFKLSDEDEVVKELVDVLEIAYSIAELRGVDRDTLDAMVDLKREERGGFEKGFIMEFNK